MDDIVWSGLLIGGLVALGILLGSGRSREDVRARRRFDARFDYESRRTTPTDATGMLRCRSCGASASERSGRCPSCGSAL